MPKLLISHRDRLLSHASIKIGECWEWNRKLDRHGYGHFKMDGRDWLAHRAAYHLIKGGIPAGLTIDHLCRNTRCINPDHLEAVTMRENLRRVPLKAACPKGHEYSDENTYWHRGVRNCRACNRLSVARYQRSRS